MRDWHESCKVLFQAVVGALGIAMPAMGVEAADSDRLSQLSDPTRPQIGIYVTRSTEGGGVGPTLQATRISPAERRAMIDGRLYGVGDRINGAVVADIQPYEVTLKERTQTTRLRLLPRLAKDPKISPGKGSGKDG